MAKKVKISKGITFHPAGQKSRRVALSFNVHERINRALKDDATKWFIESPTPKKQKDLI